MGRRFVDMRWIAQRMQFKDDRINRALAKIAAKEEEMADRTRARARDHRPRPTVTPEHLQLVKTTIAKDATPAELDLFLYDCARQGVHPLDKLIHFTKRSGKYTPITSIDFMRIRAADSGECVGIDDADLHRHADIAELRSARDGLSPGARAARAFTRDGALERVQAGSGFHVEEDAVRDARQVRRSARAAQGLSEAARRALREGRNGPGAAAGSGAGDNRRDQDRLGS